MKKANLSILGLYRFDDSIFDGLVLPDSPLFTGDNRQMLIDNILYELAEFSVIYTDPDVMKNSIHVWSRKQLNRWTHYMSVLEASNYDPFVNVDRHEEVHEEVTNFNSGDSTSSSTSKDDVSAYNETSYSPRTRNTGDTEGQFSSEGGMNRDYEFHQWGDSAISDSQDLVRKEMEIREKYDIYDIIINDFKNRFCLLIY